MVLCTVLEDLVSQVLVLPSLEVCKDASGLTNKFALSIGTVVSQLKPIVPAASLIHPNPYVCVVYF